MIILKLQRGRGLTAMSLLTRLRSLELPLPLLPLLREFQLGGVILVHLAIQAQRVVQARLVARVRLADVRDSDNNNYYNHGKEVVVIASTPETTLYNSCSNHRKNEFVV